MNGSNFLQNGRNLKALSLLFLALIGVSLILVHTASYEPAVSFLLLYFVVAAGAVAAVALLLLPAEQFSDKFSASAYAVAAVIVALMTFFSGGAASELYVLFFPIVLSSALHGSWKIGAAAFVSSLATYSLAMLPDFLTGGAGADTPQTILFRAAVLALMGVFVFLAAWRSGIRFAEGSYALDEDGSVLMELLEAEVASRGGERVAVVLVDPGRGVEDPDLLLERVRARIGEPVLLGEGAMFGLVLSGIDEPAVEGAARRALAAAASLGAKGMRAGAAIYPRDARTPEDLLEAAGRALEAAFEVESPSAVVLAGRPSGRRSTS